MNKMINIHGQRGMGLMELVITVFLVMVGVAGVSQLMLGSVQNAAQSKARAEAMSLAEAKLEDLRVYTTSSGYDVDIVAPVSAETTTGTNAVYDITWLVSTVSAPAFKVVSIDVDWEDREGPQNVSLIGQIAREEPIEHGKKMLVLSAAPLGVPYEEVGDDVPDVVPDEEV